MIDGDSSRGPKYLDSRSINRGGNVCCCYVIFPICCSFIYVDPFLGSPDISFKVSLKHYWCSGELGKSRIRDCPEANPKFYSTGVELDRESFSSFERRSVNVCFACSSKVLIFSLPNVTIETCWTVRKSLTVVSPREGGGLRDDLLESLDFLLLLHNCFSNFRNLLESDFFRASFTFGWSLSLIGIETFRSIEFFSHKFLCLFTNEDIK